MYRHREREQGATIKGRIGLLALVMTSVIQLFPLQQAQASHEVLITLIPATEASPLGAWAAYQVYARDEAGEPYSGSLRWETASGSANAASGTVAVNDGWGRFGYTGVVVGEDTVHINLDAANSPPAVATRVWYAVELDLASTVPARIVFDDAYFDTPVDGAIHYHGFTVYNAAGRRLQNSGLEWAATVGGVNGLQGFSGWLGADGYTRFGYRANLPGWDELRVSVGAIQGAAARSYGLTATMQNPGEPTPLPSVDPSPSPTVPSVPDVGSIEPAFVAVVPSAQSTPVGQWAGFGVLARNSDGTPYTGSLHWANASPSAHRHEGYVEVVKGRGQFGYRGEFEGVDEIHVAGFREATRAWYQPDLEAGSDVPARIIFDHDYVDSPTGTNVYNWFTVLNAAGEPVTTPYLPWTVKKVSSDTEVIGTRTEVSGYLNEGSSVDPQAGRDHYSYRGPFRPGYDELIVTVGNVTAAAGRSWGFGDLDAPNPDPTAIAQSWLDSAALLAEDVFVPLTDSDGLVEGRCYTALTDEGPYSPCPLTLDKAVVPPDRNFDQTEADDSVFDSDSSCSNGRQLRSGEGFLDTAENGDFADLEGNQDRGTADKYRPFQDFLNDADHLSFSRQVNENGMQHQEIHPGAIRSADGRKPSGDVSVYRISNGDNASGVAEFKADPKQSYQAQIRARIPADGNEDEEGDFRGRLKIEAWDRCDNDPTQAGVQKGGQLEEFFVDVFAPGTLTIRTLEIATLPDKTDVVKVTFRSRQNKNGVNGNGAWGSTNLARFLFRRCDEVKDGVRRNICAQA